jgi:hypothetical protein
LIQPGVDRGDLLIVHADDLSLTGASRLGATAPGLRFLGITN